MKKKKIIIGFIVFAIVLISILTNAQKNSKRNKIIPVQIEQVQRKNIEQTISANGNIKPVLDVDISANVSAEIIDITVVEGDFVSAGEVLIILDSLRYVAALKQARSTLNAAQANFLKIKSEYERGRKLFDNQLISEQQNEALEASLKLTQAEVEQTKAILEQAEDDLRKTILVAPISGTVTDIKKEKGEIALGSMFQADVILTISDLTAMEVMVKVDETDVIYLTIDNMVEIEIDALPDILLAGKVTQIAQSTQANIGYGQQDQVIDYEVQIMVDMDTMDDRIRTGMSATANITTANKENVVAIPIQALTARPEKERDKEKAKKNGEQDKEKSIYDREKEELIDVVFVAIEPHPESSGFLFWKKNEVYKVEKRPVEIGISSANFYEVKSGLDEGEALIVGNYHAISKDLKNGSKVEKKTKNTKSKIEKD